MISLNIRIVILLATALVGNALDLEFDKIECNDTLAAYAYQDDVHMDCSGDSRCSFGEQALIYGNLYYQGMAYTNLTNTTGYASATLDLMTMHYELFHVLPFNFCGEWIKNGRYNYNECPGDGKYHFEVPYQLPKSYDSTVWLATGWQGSSEMKVYAQRDEESQVILDCKLHFKTYVTQSNESDWKTLPSAAAVTFSLVGIIVLMTCCLCYLACRPLRKHVTDEDYSTDFRKLEEGKPKKVEAAKEEAKEGTQ